MRTPLSPTELLRAELAGDGDRCGHACDHHAPLVCQRAAGHAGAEVMVDVHAALVDGQVVTFDGDCDRHT